MMARLSNADRNRAIGMLQAGRSKWFVARILQCTRVTIDQLWRRFQQTGNVADRPRTGRPRVTTPNQDQYIRLQYARERFRPAIATARATVGTYHRPVSSRTVRRRLAFARMCARRPYRGPILTVRHRRAHLNWATARQGRGNRFWNSVLFSDESKFNVVQADGRERIYRRRRERFAQCCVRETNRWGGGGVMVWAGISAHHKTPLHFVRGRLNAVAYRDTIQRPIVVPFMANHGLRHFQHDNARPHAARVTDAFLQQQPFNVLPWPSLSPDLNPIEHLWDELGRRVRARPVQPINVAQLEIALQQEWQGIPQQFIRRLINSMHQRCRAVIQAGGGHTRY